MKRLKATTSNVEDAPVVVPPSVGSMDVNQALHEVLKTALINHGIFSKWFT